MANRKLSRKFGKCVKSVRKTVRARKGSTKESAAIAICTKSVLQKRGLTVKRYRKGRLITQRKRRGGVFGFSDSEKMLKKLKDKSNYPNVDEALYKYIITNVERALQDENAKKRYVTAAILIGASGVNLLTGAVFLMPAISVDITMQSNISPEIVKVMTSSASEIKAALADYNSYKPKITTAADELLQKLNSITDLEEQLKYSHDQEYKAKEFLAIDEQAPSPPPLQPAQSERFSFSPVQVRR